ncbi:MAG: stage II sporulation protein R [Clostridiales bacterium]|nr:stage II sporulation protein R [Clostridiales bacterium]
MKNKKNLYLHQSYFGLWLALLALALLLTMNHLQTNRETLAARIAPGVLRFHVMADSNKRTDQTVKLEIRSLLLDYLREHLPAQADKDTTVSYVADHRADLEAVADRLLVREGFDYRTSLSVVHDYFPSRTYAGLTFPCGYYDAVRVTLGSGRGHNWWCVLYPQFCFVEGVCSEIPEESMDILKKSIQKDDFLLLTKGFSLTKGDFLIKEDSLTNGFSQSDELSDSRELSESTIISDPRIISDPKINPDSYRNPDYHDDLSVKESRPELSLRLHLLPDFQITLCPPDP